MNRFYTDTMERLFSQVAQKRAYEAQYVELENKYDQFMQLVQKYAPLLNREREDFEYFLQVLTKAALTKTKDPAWVAKGMGKLQKEITRVSDELAKLYQSANKKIDHLRQSVLTDIGDVSKLRGQLDAISKAVKNPHLSKKELKAYHTQLNQIKESYIQYARQYMTQKLKISTENWITLYEEVASHTLKKSHDSLVKDIATQKNLSKQEQNYRQMHQWFDQLHTFLYDSLLKRSNSLLQDSMFLGEEAYLYRQKLEQYTKKGSVDFEVMQKWYVLVKRIEAMQSQVREHEIVFFVCLDKYKSIVGLQYAQQRVSFDGTIARCKKRVLPLVVPIGVVNKSRFQVTFPKHTYWSYFMLKALTVGKVESVKLAFKTKDGVVNQNRKEIGKSFEYLPKVWWGGKDVYEFISTLNDGSHKTAERFEMLLQEYK